ncbi:potassium channel family protein [Actinokineospora globicatena]|uniref:potassium channel family protein n=1 Tax=Actinokineospora globicatena TaxID=103729 RepID=UPI0025566343|nr:potassium channel family protein [Actinokineospora globicatena]
MRHRRWAAIGQLVATCSVLVAGYAWLPDAAPTAGGIVVRWAVGLGVVATVLVWQVRAIARSHHPVRRGVQALVLVVTLFLLVFAKTYYLLAADGGAFDGPLGKGDALYFTVTVFATVGFGDIVAVSPTARLLVTLQMLGDLLLLGGAARLLVTVARNRRREVDDTGHQG